MTTGTTKMTLIDDITDDVKRVQSALQTASTKALNYPEDVHLHQYLAHALDTLNRAEDNLVKAKRKLKEIV